MLCNIQVEWKLTIVYLVDKIFKNLQGLNEIIASSCLLQRLMLYLSFKFSFRDCHFRVRKSKEGTGRVVMWKMGINNSYTLEASICGSKLGETIHCCYLVGVIKQDLYFCFLMENGSLSCPALIGVLSDGLR